MHNLYKAVIQDRQLPYVGDTRGRFIPGKIIRIQGTVPRAAYRFDINLQCGPQTTPPDDIALQISVRILEGFIVLNSLRHGTWNEEIRNTNLPFNPAARFEIVLICDFYDYKVAINGRHYCEFPQRIPFDHISHLAIDGDVSIIQISYESATPTAPPDADAPKAPLLGNPQDNFELIDFVGTRAPPRPGIQPPSASEATAPPPPSYKAAVSGNNAAISLYCKCPENTTLFSSKCIGMKSGPPYPTTSSGGMPQAGPPYPKSSSGGMPQPGFVYSASNNVPSTVITPLNLRISGRTDIPPPPPGAPMPLNANENFGNPITRYPGRYSNGRICLFFVIGMILGFGIIAAITAAVTQGFSSSSRRGHYSH